MAFINTNYGEITVEKQVNVDMLPEQPATSAAEKKEDEPGERRLTTQQLIMLFESILDISLDAIYTNQSELAELLSQVSGYKKDSIRVKIANGIDYEKPQARKDAELLASLLDKIKPDIALKLRNGARK